MDKVQSTSYKGFKSQVANSKPQEGWPYANISTWVDHEGNSTQVLHSNRFDTDKL